MWGLLEGLKVIQNKEHKKVILIETPNFWRTLSLVLPRIRKKPWLRLLLHLDVNRGLWVLYVEDIYLSILVEFMSKVIFLNSVVVIYTFPHLVVTQTNRKRHHLFVQKSPTIDLIPKQCLSFTNEIEIPHTTNTS